MEFRILGTLKVLDGEREVPLGSPKERALLAVLLLHAGAVVSRERLIDELWGESPPPTAGKALNVYVSQLRKALARNGHDPLATRSPGYALEVDPERLDVARFERLVGIARERIAADNVESASRLLREALGLWRGPALDGIELESAARNQVGRLEELRLAALSDRIDCDLALGLHEQLIGELDALVAEHPLRERLRGQLILALYRSGRQGDALRCYREARETLVGELGIEPSVPLQRLEKAILNQDLSLEASAGFPPLQTLDRQELAAAAERAITRPRVWGQRRVLAALAAVVVGVAAAAAVLAARDRASAPVAVSLNSVAVIDPASHRVVASAAVGGKPYGIAVGADGVWVGNRWDSTVLSLDARTAHVVGTVGLSSPPSDVALYAGMLWVVSDFGRALWRFNPRAPEFRIAVRKVGSYRGAVPEVAHGLVFGAGSAWAVDGPDAIARIDPATGKRLDRLNLHGRFPDDMAFGEGSLWVLSQLGSVLTEVDPRTDRIAATVHVGEKPAAVAVGAGAVWVSDLESNTVFRVNPDLDLVEQTIPVGNGPTGLAVGQGRVWVANSDESTVSEIDPVRNDVVKTIHVGYLPSRIALGAGMVWVTVH